VAAIQAQAFHRPNAFAPLDALIYYAFQARLLRVEGRRAAQPGFERVSRTACAVCVAQRRRWAHGLSLPRQGSAWACAAQGAACLLPGAFVVQS
jgi:hypothetical protein